MELGEALFSTFSVPVLCHHLRVTVSTVGGGGEESPSDPEVYSLWRCFPSLTILSPRTMEHTTCSPPGNNWDKSRSVVLCNRALQMLHCVGELEHVERLGNEGMSMCWLERPAVRQMEKKKTTAFKWTVAELYWEASPSGRYAQRR